METAKRIKSAAEHYRERRANIKKRVQEIANEIRQSRQNNTGQPDQSR